MNSSTLDLAYELQVEFGWESSFAAAATNEYIRWLRLRAKAYDFESCKLPPSRVVAMVWNVHRQWTLDYANTCVSLGGFIHHYPPAMRVNVAMEQAYSSTIQMYRSEYKQDPPSQYWGPSIADGIDARDNAADGRTTSTTPIKDDLNGNAATSRGVRGRKRSVKSSVPAQAKALLEGTPSLHNDGIAKSTSVRKVGRPSRSPTKPEKDFVLRPLAPGEKRRRGRPSAAEYIPTAELVKADSETPSKRGRGRPKKSVDSSQPKIVVLDNVSITAKEPPNPAFRLTPADVSASMAEPVVAATDTQPIQPSPPEGASLPSVQPPVEEIDINVDSTQGPSQDAAVVQPVQGQPTQTIQPALSIQSEQVAQATHAAQLTQPTQSVPQGKPVEANHPVSQSNLPMQLDQHAETATQVSPPVTVEISNPISQTAVQVSSGPQVAVGPVAEVVVQPDASVAQPTTEVSLEPSVQAQASVVAVTQSDSGPAGSGPNFVPFKRPRGRPRKDGTMPRNRNLASQGSTKSLPTQVKSVRTRSVGVATPSNPDSGQAQSGATVSPVFVTVSAAPVTIVPPGVSATVVGSDVAPVNVSSAPEEPVKAAVESSNMQLEKGTSEPLVSAEAAMAEAGSTALPSEPSVKDIMDPPLPTPGISDVMPAANV